MSTTNYPVARPLLDADGNVVFLVNHIKNVIDGVDATNPVFKAPIYMNEFKLFDMDSKTGKPVPLPPEYGGSGYTDLTDLSNKIAELLGFVSSSSTGDGIGVIPVEKGGTGATSASAALTALGAAKAVRYTCTIPVSWTTNSSGGYMQSVTVAGMLATDVPIMGVVLSSTVATAKVQASAFGNISRFTTGANSVTFYAFSSAPKIALSVQLLCVRGF